MHQRAPIGHCHVAPNGPRAAQVWPGAVHFPDFLNPKTLAYWQEQLRGFRELARWSGVWIDMNEPSNFCTGDFCEPRRTSKASTRCELNCYHDRCLHRF
jgi:alpha-D-xyloside xylohydrolase